VPPIMGTWLPEICRVLEINIHEKELCVKLVIYKDYTEMHGQQNIKKSAQCWRQSVMHKIVWFVGPHIVLILWLINNFLWIKSVVFLTLLGTQGSKILYTQNVTVWM